MHFKLERVKYLVTIIILMITASSAMAQRYYMPQNRSYNFKFEKQISKVDNGFHSSIRPYLSSQLKEPWRRDTTKFFEGGKFYDTWAGRKIFKEDLIQHADEEFEVYINPLFDFHVGRDLTNEFNYYTNTRGAWVRGRIGNRVTFSTTLRENQAKFPSYIDSIGRNFFIIPGQGRVKISEDEFDYNNFTGSITLDAGNIFTFQLGHDANFIGDGYRSLLLSDNSFVYPFFKISTDVWKIKYTNLYTVFQDHTRGRINDEIFPRKYGAYHYLDINIGKRLSLGLFEAIIFSADSNNTRGFDFDYINPVIFLRSVEFSIGSPDNAFIGANARYKITDEWSAYGQMILDEFKLGELRADLTDSEPNGWWGNKYGLQLGAKGVEPFNVKNLIVQTEWNMVRPYTYQHWDSQTSYSHYFQPLAHPLGANFLGMDTFSLITVTRT